MPAEDLEGGGAGSAVREIERGDVGGRRLAAGHLADGVRGVETSSFKLSSSQLFGVF